MYHFTNDVRTKRSTTVLIPFFVLIVAMFGAGTASAVDVSGTACKNGNCCSDNFLFDTGASESFLSNACANQMGLNDDADGDGTPDLASGMKSFNNGTIDTWCFPSVAIAATSSEGDICVSTETVYVIKDTSHGLSGRNILGRPWQSDVDACYRAKTEQTWWPWPQGKVVGQADFDLKTDRLGDERGVLSNIYIEGRAGGAFVDMTFSSGLPFPVIPRRVAERIAPVTGRIDISSTKYREIYSRLEAAGMNPTKQTVFDVVIIENFDLGVGPEGYPVKALVSDDVNSNFGVLTDAMLLCTDVDGLGELVFAPTAAEFGALQFTILDCDGNEVSDNLEIEADPAKDADNDQILDVCQSAVGAACMPDGSCLVMAPGQAKFAKGVYRGHNTTCSDVRCPIVRPLDN